MILNEARVMACAFEQTKDISIAINFDRFYLFCHVLIVLYLLSFFK